MPRRSRLSIPPELHQIKAQEIYENRIAEGRVGSPEGDWEQAENELVNRRWVVRGWQLKKTISLFFKQLWRSFLALIYGIWKLITLPIWLLINLPKQLANNDTKPFALDIVKTIVSAAGLIAAVIAAFGLFVNYQNALADRRLTQERLITDRFAKAVEQIGSNKEEVVLGGIYSLERIAKDSPKDQWTIMEVLTAFVRNNSSISSEIKVIKDREEKIKVLDQLKPINIQVQAALTVIERRNADQDYTPEEDSEKKTKQLNLVDANLNGADLKDANLNGADLRNANLNGADLKDANLNGADLRNANLNGADLNSADLRNAKLFRSDFRNADLYRADLRDAFLRDANLNSANLRNVDLRNAFLLHSNLYLADLSGADLSSANLNGANLHGADLSNANLHGADLNSADLSSANLNVADLRNANLSNANLNSVKAVDWKKIKLACFWNKAVYTEANWSLKEKKWIIKDEKANQRKIQEIRRDKASDPKESPSCS